MNIGEQPVTIACAGTSLLGVLSQPPTAGVPAQRVAVVFVVGGPQYRVGSHRQFVMLARALAAAGYPALRFDVRGMGDSAEAQRGFEAITQDIDSAIGTVCSRSGVDRVVLWGLCDGASAALLYLYEKTDPRVAGLILANPWVRSDEGLAKTQLRHYYTRRMLQPSFWSELLRGRVARESAGDLWRNLRLATLSMFARFRRARPDLADDFRVRMAAAWNGFHGPILLLLSGDDYTAKEFVGHVSSSHLWQGAFARASLGRYDLQGVDHTFSTRSSLDQVAKLCVEWLDRGLCEGRPEVNP